MRRDSDGTGQQVSDEQLRAARALEASEARKAAILDTALDAIITMDHAGNVVEWNRAAERIFGYAREAAVGRELAVLIVPPALRERHRRGLAHYLATSDGPMLGRRIEIQAVRADGAEFPVELAVARIPIDGPPLFTAHIRDITAQKTADRRRTARLTVTETLAVAPSIDAAAPRLLGALGEGLVWGMGALWIADDCAGVLRCAAVWHAPGTDFGRFADATRAHAFAPGVGLPGRVWQSGAAAWIRDVTSDDNFPRAAAADGLRGAFGAPIVLGGRTVGVVEFFSPRVEEPDADLLELMSTVGAQVGQAIGRWRSEAELRAAKEEAEAANQAKTQFLAVLSHELRTPLNPILLATSAMLERPGDPGELRPTLQMIRQNVNLQARLIDDLLDVMRIVRGKMPLHWEIADCHRLIEQAMQICRSEVLGKVLRLEADLGATERHVNADPARLQQVFWNLIKNAVKFTPEEGSIAIRSRNVPGAGPAETLIVIEVSDTGIGVEPEVLPRIFDPFQQGETTITRKFGGLGLGLAICKGIVDAHGGTIVAESAGRNRGTTFRVTLKALPEHAVPPGGEPVPGGTEAGAGRTGALRILIVEDEPTTLRLMARLLRGLGHEVTATGSVAAATAELKINPFDLVVSDIGLPDGSGLELMRRAVKLRGNLPAIALTGYGMEEDIRRSREAGFTAHLTKPIDFAKLEAMIRQVAPTNPP